MFLMHGHSSDYIYLNVHPCGSFAHSLIKRFTGGDVQVEGKKKNTH